MRFVDAKPFPSPTKVCYFRCRTFETVPGKRSADHAEHPSRWAKR